MFKDLRRKGWTKPSCLAIMSLSRDRHTQKHLYFILDLAFWTQLRPLFLSLFPAPAPWRKQESFAGPPTCRKSLPPWGQALVILLSFPFILGHSVPEDFAVMMNWTISFIGEVTRYGLGGSAWSLDCSTSFVS